MALSMSQTNGQDHERGEDYAEANCRQTECHILLMYGQLKLLPLNSISRMSVSIGVLPTSRTKKSCSITWELTVRSDGRRRRSFPNLVGWFGYCVLQYSSKAHWDFSCRLSMWATSDNPQASETEKKPFDYFSNLATNSDHIDNCGSFRTFWSMLEFYLCMVSR